MKLCVLAGSSFVLQLKFLCLVITFTHFFLPARASSCDWGHFQCTEDNSCILEDFKCDGTDDCPNGSDEKGCPARGCLPNEEFSCGNSTQCIPFYWACNGNKECHNGHDEDPAVCENLECPSDLFFKCGQGKHCVPASWRCDQHNDCPLSLGETISSDEQNCSEQKCDENEQFRCTTSKSCIDKSWKCDGQMDCPDNSDEANCPKRSCEPNEFQCVSDEKCIPDRWKCDGDSDCKDGSDEWLNTTCKDKKPDASMCRETSEFFCAADHQCIPNKWKCDGQNDCTDGADEHKCEDVLKCRADQFQCKRMHYCISSSLKCDGEQQCLDGSDEWGCPKNETADNTCLENEFKCGLDHCITLDKLCDGHPDCSNNADEGSDQLTEHRAHCSMGRPCDHNNGGCQHNCVNTFGVFGDGKGHKCSCNTGFKVDPSHPSRCIDINECDQWGICSQQCINNMGSYSCRCLHGYGLRADDHKTCSAQTGEPHLLVSHRHDIRKVSTRSQYQKAVVEELRDAVAIDYAGQDGLIFWSDLTEEKIYSADEATSTKKKKVPTATLR